MRRREVCVEKLHALQIVDRIAVEFIVCWYAVLGDRERYLTVVLLDPHQYIVQALGVDLLPAGQRTWMWPGDALAAGRHVAHAVVVDAEQVERRPDRRQVACSDRGAHVALAID